MNNNNFDEIIKGIKSQKSDEEAQDYIMKNLSPNQTKQLKEVLSDKETLRKILSTPRARDLLKKFTEDKNDWHWKSTIINKWWRYGKN